MASAPKIPRKVIVFGAPGVGKSSLIKALCPEAELTNSNSSASHVTLETSSTTCEHNGLQYQFFDVRGFDDLDIKKVPNKHIMQNLVNLAKEIKIGVSLIIYVIGSERVGTSCGYKLMSEVMTKSQVPIVAVVTHCEQNDPPSSWAEEEKNSNMIRTNGGIPIDTLVVSTCFASSQSPKLDAVFGELRSQSASLLWEVIATLTTSPAHYNPDNLSDIVRNSWNYIADALHWPSFLKFFDNYIHRNILLSIGMSFDDAIALCAELEQ